LCEPRELVDAAVNGRAMGDYLLVGIVISDVPIDMSITLSSHPLMTAFIPFEERARVRKKKVPGRRLVKKETIIIHAAHILYFSKAAQRTFAHADGEREGLLTGILRGPEPERTTTEGEIHGTAFMRAM